MLINRHSLIVHISIFFSILLIIINTLFYLQYKLEKKQLEERHFKRFHEAERILHRRGPRHLPPHEREDELYSFLGMKFMDELDEVPLKNKVARENDLTIYTDEKYVYYVHDDGRRYPLMLRYENEQKEEVSSLLFALMVNGLLLLFYFYIVQKLQPLQQLKSNILRFADGDLKVAEQKRGKDEISEVSNEFNNAINKIKTLQESRNLFLRNIMHELKTPITKGKLISDLMEDRKNQERLQRIFSRFEYLIGEFTKIEQVTSNALVVDKKRFRMVDILDNALDILLIEKTILDVEINANLEVEADYELMSTALKNLIDNALKYGEGKPRVIIDEKNIIIESVGKALENSSFETAFNRAFEDSSKGLGLGLYITYHIVKKHRFTLTYEHSNGVNQFIIKTL